MPLVDRAGVKRPHRLGCHCLRQAKVADSKCPAFCEDVMQRRSTYTMAARIEVNQDQLAGFCRGHRIRSLSLFGSVLRDDFGPESDVDVLVEFEPQAMVGYFGLAAEENGSERFPVD